MFEPEFRKASQSIRILVCIQNPALRKVTIELLQRQPNLFVEGEGNDFEEVFESNWDAEVILFDLDLPSQDLADAASILAERYPEAQWIVLTSSSAHGFRERARSLNAVGFVDKSRISHDLIPEIYKAVRR
ncbi:MAG: hypothetical protein P8074_13265 [Anaerolineales bacterium]|jgi:DNA-binding NarL/FixJ family response regulator